MSAEKANVSIFKAGSSGILATIVVQETGSRNKRKFLSDLPLIDPNEAPGSPPHYVCVGNEFSGEELQDIAIHDQYGLCDMCGCSRDDPDGSKVELLLSGPTNLPDVESSRPGRKLEPEKLQGTEWNELSEDQLEELCMNSLDLIFRSAIKLIATSGYSEDVAAKAVLRADLCYGFKDTVSNIVDNTLAILQAGKEVYASKDNFFENLEQLENYLLAEMVCVLTEVDPRLNTGDAMWCLLINDMNVSQACASDGDSSSCAGNDEVPGGSSSGSTLPQLNLKCNSAEDNLPDSSNSKSPVPSPNGTQSEMPAVKGIPNLPNPRKSVVSEGRLPEKASPISTSRSMEMTFSVIEEHLQAKYQSFSSSAEKPVGGRKAQSSGAKRETIVRHKIQVDRNYRGTMRTGKLSSFGGLFLDKKLKAVSDSIGKVPKNIPMTIRKFMESELSHATVTQRRPVKDKTSASTPKDGNTPAVSPKASMELFPTVLSKAKTEPSPTVLPMADTRSSPAVLSKTKAEVSTSMTSKSEAPSGLTYSSEGVPDYSSFGIPYDKTTGKWVPNDKQDEVILKLAVRAQDLRNQLGEWTDWANQKVLQATRRLSKDKAELKVLRQEKEEAECAKKERQSLEENTIKKLSEMENALSRANRKFEETDAEVHELEGKNSKLRQEMEEAKKQCAEAAVSCKDVAKRENKMKKKLQSSENQKITLQEELAWVKCRQVKLEQEVGQAQKFLKQLEVRQKQVKKEKEDILMQAESIRKEREHIEASAELEEHTVRSKSANGLQRYKDVIRDLGSQIAQLRFKIDPSKLAALHWGADGSNVSCLSGGGIAQHMEGSRQTFLASDLNPVFQDNLQTGRVKRERECVMCLTEEMSVVFLPCAHQVVCAKCNELHEKQGMKDCPSCRTPIQRRICTRFFQSAKSARVAPTK
ncbi:hypothetical protein IFM89_032355 [Coptis chinensis]|uniref:RING-type domain-containing protein n=1 Tax=Coptis chinensis TaxID=261450 RepID=A0A835LT31_9MAGN|nr:hypothetical protein IFM89_032355 [Coptis chinensis]